MENKLIIPGCFDGGLHSGHKNFIERGINYANDHSLKPIIWLGSDEYVSENKGSGRPYFSFKQRSADIREYVLQQIEIIPMNKPFDNEHTKFFSKTDTMFTVYQNAKQWFQGMHTHIVDEAGGSHTSDINSILNALDKTTNCNGRKVGAVLLREGELIYASSNHFMRDNPCHSCSKMHAYHTCNLHKAQQVDCSPNRHAEFQVLEPSQVGDDLITTCAPCIDCAKEIVQRGIRRVVFIENHKNPEGIFHLKGNGVDTRRAGMN